MGYTVATDGVGFVVRADQAEQAVAVLRALKLCASKSAARACSAVEELVEALEDCGFDSWVNDAGDAVELIGYCGKTFEEEDVLVALAPWAVGGSFVEWRGEDGSRWRHVVRGGALYSQHGRVEWVDDNPGNPVAAPGLATVIPVQYRDGANYKIRAAIVLDGAITGSQIEAVRASLFEGEFYVPGQLGMEHLGTGAWPSFPCEDDHGWHEMDLAGIEVVAADPGDEWRFGDVVDTGAVVAVEQFVERVIEAAAAGWSPIDPSVEQQSA